MTETIKSVLFVDFDSLHRSLAANHSAAVEQLAARTADWVAALESGRLFGPDSDRRRVLIRRCYADPALLGEERAPFLSNGFQIVDCPPAEGCERNSAAIHMVLDAVDALDHPTGYEEFIFLSADTDLSPMLIRLRAHNRNSAIYVTPVTAASYRAIADAMIEEPLLAALLLSEEDGTEEAGEEKPEAGAPAERTEIEALARKISAATSVPLLAPRSYAEIFRLVVEDVTANGYHFQKTPENVANRMAEAGRTAPRRQIVFVVKGLALKGHVFTAKDTPERLAEVFREQVLYLSDQAGLKLEEREKQVLPAWIVGKPPAPSAATQEAEADSASEAGKEQKAEEAKPSKGAATSSRGRRKPARNAKAPEPAPAKEAAKASEAAKAEAAKTEAAEVEAEPESVKAGEEKSEPAKAESRAEASEPAEESETAAQETASEPAPAPEAKEAAKPSAAPAKPVAAAQRPVEAAKPSTPVRPIQIGRTLPGARAVTLPPKSGILARPSGLRPASTTSSLMASTAASRPAAPSPEPVAESRPEDKDLVESSILAAIAQAVDVLVETGHEEESVEGEIIEELEAAPEPEAEIFDEPEIADEEPLDPESPGDGDIGDEIQRIIASYSRNRKQDEPG